MMSPHGGSHTASAAPPRLARLRASRTRVAVLVASCAGLTAIGPAVYPGPSATILALLLGVVVTFALCAPFQTELAVSLVAALAFVFVDLGLLVFQRDPLAVLAGIQATTGSPAFHDPGAWASALAGGGLLIGSSVVARWCSSGLLDARRVPRAVGPQIASPRNGIASREWADRELAGLSKGGGPVTVGLVGVDAPTDDEERAQARTEIMRQLDQAVLANLPSPRTLCEYGPWERLVILPGVWAEDFRDLALHLSRVARQELRLPVRIALVTFPANGSRTASPLEYLERALEVCRAGRTSVSVGRPRMRPLTLDGAMERRVMEG